MPLFDFVCKACGKEFETLVMGSAKPQCPACGSTELEKQMSTFAVRGGSSASCSGSKCSGCAGGSCSTCH